MAAAHRLYLKMGFVPCPAYNDNPVEGLAWLVKRLDAGAIAEASDCGCEIISSILRRRIACKELQLRSRPLITAAGRNSLLQSCAAHVNS